MTFRSVQLLIVLLVATASTAHAQSAKPPRDWRTCDDSDRACQAFCDQNKQGDRRCTGDCFSRLKKCNADGYYPWGADGKNLIGPLTKQ